MLRSPGGIDDGSAGGATLVTRTFRADRGDAGSRLDHVLRRHLADLHGASRARLQRWIDQGRVRVNGHPASKPAARVAPGDEVAVAFPEPPARTLRAQSIPVRVLYEDEHLLAVDKPAGLVVHPSFGHRDGTLMNALLWRAAAWGRDRRPSLVHRLDKHTSGVLLVAKSRTVHAGLVRAMAAGGAAKDYLAVVYGRVPTAHGRIALRLARDPLDRRRVIAVATGGRESLTLYERVARSRGERAGVALLRCRLMSGRLHQIRVHLAATGWPIVGDPVYGEPRWKALASADLAAAAREFPRQALHAWRLQIEHPALGRTLEIVAPLPDDMVGLLRRAGIDPPGTVADSS